MSDVGTMSVWAAWKRLWREMPELIAEGLNRWNYDQVKNNEAAMLGLTYVELWDLGVTAAQLGHTRETLVEQARRRS